MMHIFQIGIASLITVGSLFWITAMVVAWSFRRRVAATARATAVSEYCPKVTLLKPVYGVEKDLYENLRSACLQDYPEYQVLYSVQRRDDPALPVLRALAREFGPERVTLAIEDAQVGLNGKINNLVGALPHARHDVLVISDSDVRLRPDYLRTVVAPLADPTVGAVSTFFRAVSAHSWYEQMELLTLNADHFAMAILAHRFSLADFCFGASTALRRDTLDRIGGFAGLSDYLVEDNELGQRIVRAGRKLVVLPYVVDTMVDLQSPSHWWQKQTYWDQNTRAAIPAWFAATLVLRIIPLALLFAVLRGFDRVGLGLLCAAIAVRLLAAANVLAFALRDWAALKQLWLVPIKDCLSLVWFTRAFLQRTVIWRGVEMSLTRDGRLRPALREPGA